MKAELAATRAKVGYGEVIRRASEGSHSKAEADTLARLNISWIV